MRFVFKVPYDTRRTITACKVSFVRAAWIPWQGNQRLRATANDPYRPLLFRHTHRRRPTNNMDEVLSPTSTCRPSVRPSVSRRAFVLRYIVQACLLRETNGAPLVHSPPCLNFLRREIHRSPELRSISGPPSSVYYPITHTVLPYYLQVHSLSLSLSLAGPHTQSPTVVPGNSKLCSCLCCLLGGTHFADFWETGTRRKRLKFSGKERGMNESERERVVTISDECRGGL